MNNVFLIVLLGLLFHGCAPKMGKDILIEPEGNVRFENTGNEVMFGVLALLGVAVENEMIRIGTDVKIINKWHSDVRVIALEYTLNDGDTMVALGEVKQENATLLVIPSGSQKTIPLEFCIDPKKLEAKRLLGIIQSKRKMVVKGKAIIEVWGIQREYLFEKEVTQLIQKALRGGE
jgi:hypothetical protein